MSMRDGSQKGSARLPLFLSWGQAHHLALLACAHRDGLSCRALLLADSDLHIPALPHLLLLGCPQLAVQKNVHEQLRSGEF